MKRYRIPGLLTVLAAGLLALGGCGGGDDDDAATGGADAVAEEPEPGAEADDDTSADNSGQNRAGTNLLQEQHLIQTAQLTVEVDNVLAAVRQAEGLASGSGGRIENEQISRSDGGDARDADLTLRVPGDAYESTLTRLADLGELLNQTREATDVTREVVDLESRIATQRESIERVRAILADATRLADVVTIEGELTRRQADLESLLAQQKVLSEQVGLTTIRVTFVTPDDEQDTSIGFVQGLIGGLGALATVAVVLLTVLGALLPFAIVGVVVAWVALKVRRSVRRSRPAPMMATDTAAPPGGAAPPA